MKVEKIDRVVEETNENPIEKGQEHGTSDSVVGRNVGEDRDLGVERNIGPDETVEKLGDGTFGEPLTEGVEEKLRAAVAVLLPAVKLLISFHPPELMWPLTSSSQVSETPSWKPPFE